MTRPQLSPLEGLAWVVLGVVVGSGAGLLLLAAILLASDLAT